ncbi:hypothetical protein MAR_001747, partial [Mya arenaria]
MGSTFFGSMLGSRDDTFYWHEPLRFLSRYSLFRGQDLLCDYSKPSCEIISPTANLTRQHYLKMIQETFRQGHLPCLPTLEASCKRAKHRVVKVIHTDLSGLENLYHMLPHLKMVALFRDPRGTIHSRLRTPWYESVIRKANAVEGDIAVMCSFMKLDIKTAQEFLMKY